MVDIYFCWVGVTGASARATHFIHNPVLAGDRLNCGTFPLSYFGNDNDNDSVSLGVGRSPCQALCIDTNCCSFHSKLIGGVRVVTIKAQYTVMAQVVTLMVAKN